MSLMNVKEEVLSMLSLEETDDERLSARLDAIISGVKQALSLRIGGKDVPDALSYIVRDVSLARYNRLGSEGASAHTVEGETLSYIADDFEPYALDIAEWQRLNAAKGTRTVHFL